MQVTCPNCRARYAVDPLAIGPSGRTVQCARCNEQWFQTVQVAPPPPPKAPEPAASNDDDAPPDARTGGKDSGRKGLLSWLNFKPRPKKPAPPKDKPRAEPELKKPDAEPTDSAAFDSAPVPDFVIRPGARRAQLPALIEPKHDRRMGFILAGAIALLLLMAIGMLAFHSAIANLLPPEWRTILHFDTSALAFPLHDRPPSS